MRCKACDSVLKDNERLFRKIQIEGESKMIMEDMCRACRGKVVEENDETYDSIETVYEFLRYIQQEWEYD